MSSLVKKKTTDHNKKITEIKNKLTDYNHYEHISTPEFCTS